MLFTTTNNYSNTSELDQYIKSHLPADYFLEPEQFSDEAALIDDLALYFTQQPHFQEQFKAMTPEIKDAIARNYRSVKQLLTDIEPQYIENAIDELWEGLQEETIYGKYNKNGIINF